MQPMPSMEGFLDKQGGMFKGSWERRFFVLTVQGVLYWFKEVSSASRVQ